MVIEDVEGARRGDYGAVIEDIVSAPSRHGLERLELGVDAMILEYVGAPTDLGMRADVDVMREEVLAMEAELEAARLASGSDVGGQQE